MSEKKTVKCRTLRDVWTEDGERIHSGSEVDLPVETAMDRIEQGLVERVK